MFLDNKYTRIYFRLIEKRKLYPIAKDQYRESHHIIPRSLGGSDLLENLVDLSGREHYIAHKLLTRITEGSARKRMWWAFHRMVHSKNYTSVKLDSHEYEVFRKNWSQFIKQNHPSKTSDTWSENVSASLKENWSNDSVRKEIFSSTMKKNITRWRNENKDEFAERQKAISLKGKLKNCKRYVYNGIEYVGLLELKRMTGLSKKQFLYYEHGIDPNFRKGRSGPMSIEEIDFIIDMFCDRIGVTRPYAQVHLKEILDRMKGVSLLSEDQVNKYIAVKF